MSCEVSTVLNTAGCINPSDIDVFFLAYIDVFFSAASSVSQHIYKQQGTRANVNVVYVGRDADAAATLTCRSKWQLIGARAHHSCVDSRHCIRSDNETLQRTAMRNADGYLRHLALAGRLYFDGGPRGRVGAARGGTRSIGLSPPPPGRRETCMRLGRRRRSPAHRDRVPRGAAAGKESARIRAALGWATWVGYENDVYS